MLKQKVSIFKRFSLLLVAVVMTFLACQLTQNGTTVDSLSFTNLYDSLAQYESVTIVIKAKDGTVMDTIYQGKVDTYAEIEKLRVKGWDGGEILVEIIGFNGGIAVYKVEKNFDGKTDRTNSTSIIFVPGTTLTSNPKDLLVFEGDSLLLPIITISPVNLSNKNLIWKSSNQTFVSISGKYVKGNKVGAADLTVALQVDTTRSFVFKVSVERNTKIPESLALSPETLFVATAGAAEHLSVVASPLSASHAVIWSILDPLIASVDSNGAVIGIKKGITVLKAVSKEKSSIFDTAVVVVSDPVPVEKIRYLKDSTEIFIRGAAEKLLVEVLPAKSNPAVDFIVTDPLKVELKNGSITGLIEGTTFVIVKSKENPLLMDTLSVRVSATQIVDSVRISPRALKLFTGGESGTLIGKVLPNSASSKIQWSSTNSDIASVDASGKVIPRSPGNIKIRAISLADSLKQDSIDVLVKRDPAQMTIGSDTVISVGQILAFLPVVPLQEYGVVVQFKWDLDGNLAWDDSSAAVKSVSYKFDTEKEYNVRFYVRDTEGNETIVAKKVRAVIGPRVNISSPTNNSYSRVASITVTWTVNDTAQILLTTETLKDGPNTITRTVKDAAGTPFSTSVLVTLDSVSPNKPIVKGAALISNAQPTWTWASGGLGGNGTFRFALDIENFATAAEVKDTLYKPSLGLSEGPHTLFVQERDAAGNWSASGRLTTKIDITAPAAPSVKVNPSAVSNNPKPVWSWTGSGSGMGVFQYKVDNTDFSTGATETVELSFTPATNMLAGLRVVYVREKDSSGNWSELGNAQVTLDFTGPTKPVVTGSSPTSTNPNWKWVSGGGGGSGDFRYKLATDPTAADAETRLLEYTLTPVVSGTTYTLFVQERDAAGNWSTSSSLPIKYDLTKPNVAISLPQASGTYITTVNATTLLALSGTASGPNAISKVTFTVDDVGPSPAVLATGGAWSLNVTLPTEKTYVIKVTATDILNNTGEATLSVLRDNTPPPAPTIETNPPASVNTNSATWTWSAVAEATTGSGLNRKFRYSLNGGLSWVETTEFTVTISTLREGNQTFSLQQQDNANYWSASKTSPVMLDTRGPVTNFTAPTTNGQTHTSTTTRNVQIKLTAVDTGVGVKKVDCALTGTTTGIVTTTLAGGTWNATPAFNAGVTTVACTGYDNFNKAGTTVSIDVNINLPKPVISNYSVTPGMVTSKTDFTITYNVTGTTIPESKSIHLSEGNNSILITTEATNAVGEHGTTTVNYWLREAVVFVNGSASGNNDGTSWADAYVKFENAISDPRTTNLLSQVWVSKGIYLGNYYGATSVLPSSTIFYGGFDATSSYPTSVVNRDIANNKTTLQDFNLGISNLGNRLEFNGFEFLDDKIGGTFLTAKIGGTIAINNCRILGIKSYYEIWTIECSVAAINFEMNNDTVSYTPGHGSWGMTFLSVGGKFLAKNSKFTGGGESFQSRILGSNTFSDGLNYSISFEFDHCELNYPLVPDHYITHQFEANNTLASAYFSYCKVKGGKGSLYLSSDSYLYYDDIERHNTTIP
jgi:hypothetical protein